MKLRSDFSDARDNVELGQQAPVAQRVGNAIQQTNHFSLDKCYGNLLSYPIVYDLSNGECYPPFVPLVQQLVDRLFEVFGLQRIM